MARTPCLIKMYFWKRVFDFLLPRYCKVCGRRLDTSETNLCVSCYLSMPFLDYQSGNFSPAERILLTERNVVRAASVIQYEKESNYRRILFHLKYWNHPEVGTWLACIGAERLAAKGFFEGIDSMVTLPLSAHKYRKRGYNQCDYIAQGISRVTGLPLINGAVERDVEHQRQAGLGRYQRWGNAEGLFSVPHPELLEGRHILLIDDVMTTGATLCSLIDVINDSVRNIRISVFTLAIVVS